MVKYLQLLVGISMLFLMVAVTGTAVTIDTPSAQGSSSGTDERPNSGYSLYADGSAIASPANKDLPIGGDSLTRLAHSDWFALLAGLASIISVVITLYGTQIRTLSPSYYRSLTWRRNLLIAVGIGLAVTAGISFYKQEPPSSAPVFSETYAFLHGNENKFMPGEEGTSVWGIFFLLGIVLLGVGLAYNPLKKIRKILTEEYEALEDTKNKQLEKVFKNKEYAKLSDIERNSYRKVSNYFDDVQTRLLNVLIGHYPSAGAYNYLLREMEDIMLRSKQSLPDSSNKPD